MTRDLHEQIKDAEEVVDGSDATHKQVAGVIDMTSRNYRKWRAAELKDKYKSHKDDEKRLKALIQWMQARQSVPDSSGSDQEAKSFGVGGYGRPVPPSDGDDETPPDAHVSGHTAGHSSLDPEAVVERQRELHARRRQKERSKQSQTVRFDYGPIALAFQGDEHYGNSGCDIDHALEDAKIIAETPGMYAIKMGDIIDNFIIAYLQSQNAKPSLSVREQWECAKYQLDLMSGSVIGVVGGNHTAWSRALTHLDPVRDITPDNVLYDPNELQFRVKVGRAAKDVFIRHKFSKGHSQWNSTHALEKAASFTHPGHDIYAAAHQHSGLHLKLFANRGGGYSAAIQTDTYKRYDDYGDEQGYSSYSKDDVAGALVLHEDGEIVPMKSLQRASAYMDKFYTA